MCIVTHIFSRQATSKSENTPPDDYNPGENIASEDHPKNISGNLRDVAHNLHMAVQGTVIACFCICMNRGFVRLSNYLKNTTIRLRHAAFCTLPDIFV